MPGRLRASVIVIGDEILRGYVQDANSGWLAGRLHEHGVHLDRIVTVPDDLAAIDEALGAELRRSRPRVIVTSGGIGTTPDDRTFEAVAQHLGVGLALQQELDDRLSASLDAWQQRGEATLGPEHEQALRKLALAPAGAYLLTGPDGKPHAVAVDVDGGSRGSVGATIVILPGIPGQFRAIVGDAVEPSLLAGRGAPEHIEELTHEFPESALSPILGRVAEDYPDVHVGSYPGPRCTVRLSGPQPQVSSAMAAVREQLDRLEQDPRSAALRSQWRAYW